MLTELGPDADALRSEDRDAILFDLGIGALQVDCLRARRPIRTWPRDCACTAGAVLAPGNPAMGVILAASPHRVFISRLGRIEVYQPIPPTDGKSPEGPHTHVLPDLLRHRRTPCRHRADPGGLDPCAHLYPRAPGARRHWATAARSIAARHDAFQDMLRIYGDPDFLALKQRVPRPSPPVTTRRSIAVTEHRFARTQRSRGAAAAQGGGTRRRRWRPGWPRTSAASGREDADCIGIIDSDEGSRRMNGIHDMGGMEGFGQVGPSRTSRRFIPNGKAARSR